MSHGKKGMWHRIPTPRGKNLSASDALFPASNAVCLVRPQHFIACHDHQRLNYAESHRFLSRSDLGSQYPLEDFPVRATRLLQNASVSVIARDTDGKIVGVALGLTDFASFLLVTDLGVVRDRASKGIEIELLNRPHELAGGWDTIIRYADAAPGAVGFTRSTVCSR